MKTKLLLSSMLLLALVDLGFAQNRSNGAVATTITPVLLPPTTSEAFRFRSGLVTQLDSGTAFDFTPSSQWFSFGRLTPSSTSQTLYGLRVQRAGRGLVMGYSGANQSLLNLVPTAAGNPFIQWVGNNVGTTVTPGDLEFRTSVSSTNPLSDILVATMTSNGNTIFGNPTITGNNAKVSIEDTGVATGLFVRNINSTGTGVVIENAGSLGLRISSNVAQANVTSYAVSSSGGVNSTTGATFSTGSNATTNTGISLRTGGGKFDYGIRSNVTSNAGNSEGVGVQGTTLGVSSFEAAIYGRTPQNNGNQFAGFFDGEVFSTINFTVSDEKLKENLNKETNALDRLAALNSFTYTFKNMKELNLPKGMQHGFIAQEVAAVFPELTRDIKKPVYDNEGNVVSNFEFKTVNYDGLVSVLTAAVNELNTELKTVKQELADLKSQASGNKSLLDNTNGVLLEQNTPNPFTDRTTIKYQLTQGTNFASIIVFDLNGRIIKEFPIKENKGQIEVNASQIGKGLFIYSLVQDGKELLSRKMIIK